MKKAFTLIEFLVTAAIIAILAAVILPQFKYAGKPSVSSELGITGMQIILKGSCSDFKVYKVVDPKPGYLDKEFYVIVHSNSTDSHLEKVE